MSGDASAEEDAILEELAMISRNPPQDLQDEEDEERDSFHIPGDMPSPLSLPSSSGSNPNAGSVHRPIPMLSRVGGQHPRLQALQASSGQCSLPVVTTNTNIEAETALNSNGKQGMSRSISDSTLRRAALHLNLNQSVLPSFTSLQQFKVWSCP